MAYRHVYAPKHPRADLAGGFVPLHVIVAEAKLGRPIAKGEVIHHQDFCKTNNDPDNYTICDRTQHQQIPLMQAVYLHEKGLYDDYKRWWLENRDVIIKLHKTKQQIAAIEDKMFRKEVREIVRALKRLRNGTTGTNGGRENTGTAAATAGQTTLSLEARRLTDRLNELNSQYLVGLPKEILPRVQEIINASQDPALFRMG